eukprot:5964654-Pyramimonas_sp.AAC.1
MSSVATKTLTKWAPYLQQAGNERCASGRERSLLLKRNKQINDRIGRSKGEQQQQLWSVLTAPVSASYFCRLSMYWHVGRME